jgi:hypothetical protein
MRTALIAWDGTLVSALPFLKTRVKLPPWASNTNLRFTTMTGAESDLAFLRSWEANLGKVLIPKNTTRPDAISPQKSTTGPHLVTMAMKWYTGRLPDAMRDDNKKSSSPASFFFQEGRETEERKLWKSVPELKPLQSNGALRIHIELDASSNLPSPSVEVDGQDILVWFNRHNIGQFLMKIPHPQQQQFEQLVKYVCKYFFLSFFLSFFLLPFCFCYLSSPLLTFFFAVEATANENEKKSLPCGCSKGGCTAGSTARCRCRLASRPCGERCGCADKTCYNEYNAPM